MAAKSIVDEKLLFVIRFGEFQEQDLGGEVVDIRESQSHQACLELMRNDLIKEVVSRRLVTLVCPCREEEAESQSTLTSRDENLCFMLVIEFAQTLKRIYLKLAVKLQLARSPWGTLAAGQL